MSFLSLELLKQMNVFILIEIIKENVIKKKENNYVDCHFNSFLILD